MHNTIPHSKISIWLSRGLKIKILLIQYVNELNWKFFSLYRRHRQMGFTRGYSVGEEAGWRDGYIFGMRKGAQLSAEIGFYQGFAHAWISILEREDANKQRKISALNSLLEMTRNFPRTNNLLEDDTIQKLARIRAKFKQINALILGGSSYQGGSDSFSTSAQNSNIFIPKNRSSTTPQDSGIGFSSSFLGTSPTCNFSSSANCPQHYFSHHHSNTVGPSNVEMSF
ncbi:fad oxidoreductase [Sarcoptes scabiei]|nr:fad oxidoreductase [Sarcoptes scabiei]